jgi:hypothetical protein
MKEVDKENITLPDYLPEDVDSPKAHTLKRIPFILLRI